LHFNDPSSTDRDAEGYDGSAAHGLNIVETLAEPLSGYFYFHGIRGALLEQLGRNREARQALREAIGLAGTAAEAAHIREHLDHLETVEPESCEAPPWRRSRITSVATLELNTLSFPQFAGPRCRCGASSTSVFA